MRHAFIVPLVGGQVLGQEKSLGSRPEYLLSYTPFKSNDSHIVNYYGDVPYHLLDEGTPELKKVDVIGTTCPCAGLSTLSHHASPDAAANEWMYRTAEYVLENLKPEVFWGENSPQFANKLGQPVVQRLLSIARLNDYSMSIYRTRSLLHGLPQVRERSFYFFWRGEKVPLLNYFSREVKPIEKVLDTIPKRAKQRELTNEKTPSKHDSLYRFVLEHVEGGISHVEYYDRIEKTYNPMDYLEDKGYTYDKVAEWMRAQGMRSHFMTEIEERGAEAVIRDAIAEALDGPDAIWISLDIDVVDPGLAPGTGTPEPGGMLTRELLRALRQIAQKVPIAGMDIVEVSPPYDWAESTAMIANRAALEVISSLAKRKAAGETIRWKGQR